MKNIGKIGNSCTGCGACFNICPTQAITMQENEEGFLYPVINEDTCVSCGKCLSACPINHSSFSISSPVQACYAAAAQDNIALLCSSGGVFSLLAKKILDEGGYVCGAAFDDNWLVEHRIISDFSHLKEVLTSKYLQSDTKKIFTQIKKLLSDNKKVLFSGTPCQVAGLYGFLGQDYPQLITCDVFCHGVPSPGVWKKYIQEIADSKTINNINFRDKIPCKSIEYSSQRLFLGWQQYELSIDHIACGNAQENIYMQGFLRNLYLRYCCHNCQFSTIPRVSDLSIGDFWGYENINKQYDSRHGVSAVLINTDKGKEIFSSVEENMKICHTVNINDIVKGNPVLHHPCPVHENRKKFFIEYRKNTKIVNTIKNMIGKNNVGILNFSSLTYYNFGAVLVGYAMEQTIKKLGYCPYTINFIDPYSYYKLSKDVFEQFRLKFMHMTGVCKTKEDCQKYINPLFDKIIIGSDQIVRHPCHNDFIYYLDWTTGKKNLMAYAASFAVASLGMDKKNQQYAQKCLERFDNFSVREQSGAEIMENEFGMPHIPVLCDPTLLVDIERYQDIIDNESTVELPDKYVAYYLLDADKSVLKKIEENYPVINAYRDDLGQYRHVGDWLNIIKNATYVVTDSFHGSVFSILFHKKFVVMSTETRGNERLDTLMKITGINRCIGHPDIIEEDMLDQYIDYDQVENYLEKEREKGLSFLEKALKTIPSEKFPISVEPEPVAPVVPPVEPEPVAPVVPPVEHLSVEIKKVKKQYFYLFNIIPLFCIEEKNESVRLKFFKYIPIFKIRHGRCYFFNGLYIGKVREKIKKN